MQEIKSDLKLHLYTERISLYFIAKFATNFMFNDKLWTICNLISNIIDDERILEI